MLNKDLFRLKLGLEAVGELTGIDFAYAVAKNLQVITAEVEAILKTKVPKKNYQEYDAARIALCEEHCLRDDTGVDGTGNNAASKADVDARLGVINDNIAELAAKSNALRDLLRDVGMMA